MIATQSVPYCFAQQFLRCRLLLLFYRLQLGFLWVHIWVRDSFQSLWSWLKNSPFEVCGNAGINARDMAEGGGRNYKEHNCLAKTSFSSGDWYPSMALMLRHNGALLSKAYPTMELQCTRGSIQCSLDNWATRRQLSSVLMTSMGWQGHSMYNVRANRRQENQTKDLSLIPRCIACVSREKPIITLCAPFAQVTFARLGSAQRIQAQWQLQCLGSVQWN